MCVVYAEGAGRRRRHCGFYYQSLLIDARGFDRFRWYVRNRFDKAYIVDLGGDIRAKGTKAGGNVFGIMTGVAITFLVKLKNEADKPKTPCELYYYDVDKKAGPLPKSADKLFWLTGNDDLYSQDKFHRIKPDKDHNWINLSSSDFDKHMPECSKQTKLAKFKLDEEAIFKVFCRGVCTNRDEWVHDFDRQNLMKKARFFIETYNNEIERWKNSPQTEAVNDFVNRKIKWTSELENYMKKAVYLEYDRDFIIESMYRPFVRKHSYFSEIITHRPYQMPSIFGYQNEYRNLCICFSGISSAKPFQVLAVNKLVSVDTLEKTQCLPLYVYDGDGNRYNNITDFALHKYRTHYNKKDISRQAIFNYVYAVLHAASYRKAYAIDLKRHFPRIPFYTDFHKLSTLGKRLVHIHTHFEFAPLYPLDRIDAQADTDPLPKLRAIPEERLIHIDTQTRLVDIPSEAWDYKLGNRTPMEWALDQYKAKKSPNTPNLSLIHI